MRATFLLVLLTVAVRFAPAQPTHQFSGLTGLQGYLTREPILSPLAYRGGYLPLQLSYAYTTDRYYQEVRVTYGTGELTSSITTTNEFGRQHYAELLAGQFRYAYLRRIRSFGQHTWYGGGSLHAAYFDKELNYVFGREGRAADVFIAPALATALVSQYAKKHRVRGQLAFAPFAYVAARTYAANRPPLPLIDKELSVANALKYGDWLGPTRFAYYGGDLEYQYQFSPRWQARLSYQFQHYRYDKIDPFAVRSVVHTLLTGLSVSL